MGIVLVVDDSPIMRNLMIDYLTDLGHHAIGAGTGEEALTHIRKRPFDLCICDLHLPALSGRDLYRHMEAVRPGLVCIFTDSMPDAISEEIVQEGRHAYLKKPFELYQLRAILERTLVIIRQF